MKTSFLALVFCLAVIKLADGRPTLTLGNFKGLIKELAKQTKDGEELLPSSTEGGDSKLIPSSTEGGDSDLIPASSEDGKAFGIFKGLGKDLAMQMKRGEELLPSSSEEGDSSLIPSSTEGGDSDLIPASSEDGESWSKIKDLAKSLGLQMKRGEELLPSSSEEGDSNLIPSFTEGGDSDLIPASSEDGESWSKIKDLAKSLGIKMEQVE